MSNVEFDSPANRIIQQLQPQNKFRLDTSLPDLTFLRQLSVQGRLWYEQAGASATNANLIVRTPATGATDFIYTMSITVLTATASIDQSYRVTLTNGGMTRAVLDIDGFVSNYVYFPILDSLVGDDVKTFNIGVVESNAANINVNLFGWTENTSRIRDVAP